MSGGNPALVRLSAREQLAVKRDYPELVPLLCGYGLSVEDAAAVAYNTTLVYYALAGRDDLSSPEGLLGVFSLEEIADLARAAAAVQEGTLEYGVNASFKGDDNG
ncbi:MAG: hypothetical protein LBV27_08240 [Oscillospiraceae bacterium]|nr:hypothetical protein [Oscillospiraceae bacterium]